MPRPGSHGFAWKLGLSKQWGGGQTDQEKERETERERENENGSECNGTVATH